MTKSIFITGGDGFIGSHLAASLITAGHRVKALAQYNSFNSIGWLADLPKIMQGEIDIVMGDVRDTGQMLNECKGMDQIMHLAALISIPYSYVAPQSYIDTNVSGTLNMLQAARTLDIPIIHTSTSEVYGTAQYVPIDEKHPFQGQSPYSATKIAADKLVESFHLSFGLPVVTARPFNTFGPRQSTRAVIPTIIKQLIDPNTEVLKLGDLSPIRDFNYVENTVEAFIHLMFAGDINYGEAYNAGSGSTITIGDTVKLIEKNVGIKKQIISDERKSRPSKSEVFELIADYSKFNEATGWEPKITFEQGIQN